MFLVRASLSARRLHLNHATANDAQPDGLLENAQR